MTPRDRLAFALDVHSIEEAEAWIARLRDVVGVFKVGLELFTAAGPDTIKLVRDADCECFLDLKLHDIPATMVKAVTAASRHGARYLTVHAAAGPAALTAAAEAAYDTTLLAVTVLTSLDKSELDAIGIAASPEDAALRLAKVARDAGVDGFVTSAHECAALRAAVPEDSIIVVPGIRYESGAKDDQRRVATPAAAIKSGADILVVGRIIRNSADPAAVAASIVEDIERAQAR